MARWPVCVELPPGLGAELASWPDDPEILHDAIERLRAARSALARELGAGVRARRGDASERAAWSSLLERAPEARPAERAGARAAGFASTRAPLAPGVDASSDAAASSDADRRRADSAAPTRTPRDSSGGTYRRLASSQLRGMYSLSASAEFRAAEAAARSAGERVERSVSDADADADAAEKVADTPVAATRSRLLATRERSDSIGAVAVDAVASVSPETRKAEKGAERIKSSEEKKKTRLSAGSAPRVFRLRIRDVENVSALVVAENLASRSREASCSFGDHSGDVTRVFLCAATRTKKEAPPSFRSGKRHPEDDGVERRESSRACFLLHATTRLNASKRGTGDVSSDVSSAARKRKQKSHPDPGDFETDLETVARRVSISKRKREEPSFAFGDDAKHPWVAHVAESGPDFDPRSRREKDVNRVHSVGVRVFPLDGSSSPGAFLATPFAPTKVAASRGGEWLVACGARGVCALWRGDDVREALRKGAERSAFPGTGHDVFIPSTDDFSPVLLAAPRYGGVAPRGDAPDVLAFADDGKTLFAAHDGALFATWTLTEEGKELSRDETNEDETNRLKSLETRGGCSSSSWRLCGVSYSTRETVCDGAAHVFGEASDEEAERDDPDRVPRRTGFAFKSGAFARNTRDRPSLLVALARAKPEERLSNDTPCDVSRARLAVGLLDHTAGRGEAHRGAVFGGASFFETKDAFDEENDEETARGSGLGETRRFGSGFDPVALAGARGGYAAVVGADGAVYVWDVVTGETLDAWYVDAAADEKTPRDVNNIRVAIAPATGFVQTEHAHLTVAVAFESGDDVVVETRRVRLPAEDTRGKRRRVS